MNDFCSLLLHINSESKVKKPDCFMKLGKSDMKKKMRLLKLRYVVIILIIVVMSQSPKALLYKFNTTVCCLQYSLHTI